MFAANLAEHMGMPVLELVGDASGHCIEIVATLFGRELRMEHDLEQQIAEFIAQRRVGSGFDRTHYLVGFLERIAGQRAGVLRQIPGTASRRITQPPHHRQQTHHSLQ